MNKEKFDKELEKSRAYIDKYLDDLAIGFEAKFDHFNHLCFFTNCLAYLTARFLEESDKFGKKEKILILFEGFAKIVKEDIDKKEVKNDK